VGEEKEIVSVREKKIKIVNLEPHLEVELGFIPSKKP
jgi:hypothetical protein